MRVLFLTNIPSPYRVCFFNELGKYCELTVLFERKMANDRNPEWLTEEFHKFKGVVLKGGNIGADSALCPSVLKWLTKGRWDIIVVSGYATPTAMLAITWMRLCGIPFWLNSDGGFIHRDPFYRRALKRILIGGAESYLVSSRKGLEYFVHHGANREKCFLYPFTSLVLNDIFQQPATQQEKIELRQTLSMGACTVTIAVGQLIYRKGMDVLIRAWQKVGQGHKLLLVGGGELETTLRKQVRAASLSNVIFIDFKRKEELVRYYRASDLFILPTRYDVWGLVVNEAMAAGLPVVSTDLCGSAVELIEEGVHGFVVASEDVDALANKALLLLDSEKYRQVIGCNNIKKMAEYTIEKMAARHIELFSQAGKLNKKICGKLRGDYSV